MAKKITVQTRCPKCGRFTPVEVYPQDLADYKSGKKHPQDAFPYLSPDEREMLMTGICPDCWDDLFPDDEDLLPPEVPEVDDHWDELLFDDEKEY